MSIHLDGLQQSRAIIDKASYSFKQTLRRLNTNSNDVEDATQPFKTAPVKEEKEVSRGKINSFLEKTVKSLESESIRGTGQSTGRNLHPRASRAWPASVRTRLLDVPRPGRDIQRGGA